MAIVPSDPFYTARAFIFQKDITSYASELVRYSTGESTRFVGDGMIDQLCKKYARIRQYLRRRLRVYKIDRDFPELVIRTETSGRALDRHPTQIAACVNVSNCGIIDANNDS